MASPPTVLKVAVWPAAVARARPPNGLKVMLSRAVTLMLLPAGMAARAPVVRVPGLAPRVAGLRQRVSDQKIRARAWTREHGEDLPEVASWMWAG